MFGSKKKEIDENNLIRVHQEQGGVDFEYEEQYFKGVSADIFFGLDRYDPKSPYIITRKLNIGISVDPNKFSVKDFFELFTADSKGRSPFKSGVLSPTDKYKCEIHGDIKTGLRASDYLKELLKSSFTVAGVKYDFFGVGVAANPNYGAVDHRQGNDFSSNSSHFEIKFQSTGALNEFICLNIHLTAKSGFDKEQVIKRLKVGISLFYSELSLSTDRPRTNLKEALSATLDNFEKKGFSCKHPDSLAVLEKYKALSPYKPSSSHTKALSAHKPSSSRTLADFLQMPVASTVASSSPPVPKKFVPGQSLSFSKVTATKAKDDGSMKLAVPDKSKEIKEEFPPLGTLTKKKNK